LSELKSKPASKPASKLGNSGDVFYRSVFTDSGLAPREAQLSMMACIDQALENNSIAVIEGGTGVGKTFAYLLPVLTLLSQEENLNLRVVIATATVTLQEQILKKDLPEILTMFRKSLGEKNPENNLDNNFPNISIEIAKGRGRYVCPQRLYGFHGSQQGDLSLYGIGEEESENNFKNKKNSKNNAQDSEIIDELQEKLSLGAWSGDRDELDQIIPQSLWSGLIAETSTCSNRRCSYFSECPYFKVKKNLSKAKLIITNHDLLLSDLALGSGVLLPELANTIYIIDEAHHFPQKTLGQFESETLLLGSKLWLRSLETYLPKWQQELKSSAGKLAECQKNIENLKINLDLLYQELEKFWGNSEEYFLFENMMGDSGEDLREKIILVLKNSQSIGAYLSEFHGELVQTQDKEIADFEKVVGLLGILIKKNYSLSRTLEMFLIPDQEPIAKWMTFNQELSVKKQDFILHAAWMTASELLKQFFWGKIKRPVILCSATLRTLGSFESYLKKAGLEADPRVSSQFFISPFNYQESFLNIPNMKNIPEGAESEKYVQEVIENIKNIINKNIENNKNIGGVLVLFASQKLLQEVLNNLEDAQKKFVLYQGQESKMALLSKHHENINKNIPSILFGLQSFSEGVDLPGKYCTHVVIVKLPFAPPTSPIERAYQKWLVTQNKNPFREHTLPEASLKLTQAVGRLIRRDGDVGEVTILDHRMMRKFYGKMLIKSLPNFKLNI